MSQSFDSRIDMVYYNTKDGLAQNHVFNIQEGPQGFMWFCTMGGLSRFDGFDFVNYSYKGGDTTSISNNYISNLLIDSKNRFWVTTRRGLNLFNPETGTSQRFLHDPNNINSPAHNYIEGIAEDANGIIWFAHKRGVDSYNPKKNIFRHYLHPKFDIMRHVGDIAIDHDNQIWAGSMYGLFRVNQQEQKLDHFPLAGDPNNRYSKIFNVRVNEENEIWVVGKKGLGRFDRLSNNFFFEEINMTSSGFIDFIQTDSGIFYLGTVHQGLMIWDANNQTILVDRPYAADDPFGVMANSIYSLYQDSRNNIWIGLFNGLNRFFPNEPRYAYHKFEKGENNLGNTTLFITEDAHKNLWVNTMQGLQLRPAGQSTFQRVNQSPGFEEYYKPIDAIAATQDGVYMQLLNIGVYNYDKVSNEIKALPNQHVLTDERINLFSDPINPSYLYVASKTGICHYNPHNSDTTWIHPSKLSSELTNDIVKVIDHWNDQIVFVNSGKLCLYNPKTKKLSLYKNEFIPNNGAIKNLVSTEDYIYVGVSAKILQFDKQTHEWNSFDDQHGIRQYSTFHADFEGNLWLAAGNHLLMINTISGDHFFYETDNGYITRRAQRTASGNILFSTAGGLMEIDPKQFYHDLTSPQIIFKGIDVYNKPLPLDKQSNFVNHIDLTYDQRFITLHFAALHFIFEDQINYRYRLVGLDKGWLSNGTKREVSYTNLAHGDYTFEVQATTEDNIASDILQIEIKIETPFYKSIPFYVLMGLTLAAILYGLYRTRLRIQQSQKEKELAEKNAQYKSMFLAHMSHEIRTPLNAIMGLNQLLLDSELNVKNKKYSQSIAISCDNLLMIVNDILDQSKIEHGVYLIEQKNFNLKDLLSQIETLFTIQADKKDLKLHLPTLNSDQQHLIGDPVRLFQILTNLIGNAIKFTTAGSIHLDVATKVVTEDEITLQFAIRDTGIGISKGQLDLIFESFGQVNEIELIGNQGTGLGLSIVKDLVAKMKGEIYVESIHGQGSTFTVMLPFGIPDQASKVIKKQARPISDKSIRILLAEDTALNQLLVNDIVKKYFPKASMDVADNGQLAVEAIKKNDYDVVLMDVKMPVMNGILATQEIRANLAEKGKLSIIGLTANAIPQQVEECIQAGMDQVITKPIIIEEFISALSKINVR